MRTHLKKRGNRIYVWIPSGVLQSAKMHFGETVEVREQAGAIVIEPLGRKEYDLEELIKKIRRNRLHREIDFGGPVGLEWK